MHVNPRRLPLPPPSGEPGLSRFDDPKGLYVVRYLATKLEGCLIELLARFRDNRAADERLAEVANVEREGIPLDRDGTESKAEAVGIYLGKQLVVRAHVSESVSMVRINDALVLNRLNGHPRVREALDVSEELRTLGKPAELDEGTIRIQGRVGRGITQAVSRAIYEEESRPGGIRYFSRLDDAQECWAVFDRVSVDFEEPIALSKEDPNHRDAVIFAAKRLSVELPSEWRASSNDPIPR